MKKCFEELCEFVSKEIELGDNGSVFLDSLLGAMSTAEEEVIFNSYKDVIENGVIGMIGINSISQTSLAKFLELLDNCTFEDSDSCEFSVRTSVTNLHQANEDLVGMVLYSIGDLFSNEGTDEKDGKSFTFCTNKEDETKKFRTFIMRNDGTMLISEEY